MDCIAPPLFNIKFSSKKFINIIYVWINIILLQINYLFKSYKQYYLIIDNVIYLFIKYYNFIYYKKNIN